ncbi:MAG: DUF4249 domain-containing protein [Ekhidna sp.]
MKNILRSTLLFAIGIMILSCEEEVTPPQIEDAEDRIVVNGLIAPSFEQINVEVSKSRKAFGIIDFNNSDIIQNATVTISNGTEERSLTFDGQHYSLSTTSYPIEEGVTYRITVTALGETVYGETTVPSAIPTLESAKFIDDFNIEVIWMDLVDQKNYYRVVANVDNDEEYSDPFFFGNDEFVSDFNRDGQLLSASGEGYIYGNSFDRAKVRIISSDQYYYDYYEVLVNYEGEDPFADPERLPSNIEGGLGIFSSIQVSEFVIER